MYKSGGTQIFGRLKNPDYAVIGSHSPSAKQSVRFYAAETELILFGTEKIADLNSNSGGRDTEYIEVWKIGTEDIPSYRLKLN